MAALTDATLLLGMLGRALKLGGVAFGAEMKRDDAALCDAFARAHVVWVLWPDEQSVCGFSVMPAKRSPGEDTPDALKVVAEVIPCEDREVAFALQKRFGDAALIQEFASAELGNNVVPFRRRRDAHL